MTKRIEERAEVHSPLARLITSRSEEDTRRLGRALAEAVSSGTVIALCGDLGAGKTRLAQAVAEGLGVDRAQTGSPTFVLIHEYTGRLPVYHLDAYRVRDLDEFLELGVEELFAGEGVCLIEWADRVEEALPQDHLRIDIDVTGPETRTIRLTAAGPAAAAVLARVHSNYQN